jgi:hypothetical protein
MPIVHRIPELECKDSIGIAPSEFFTEFCRRQSKMIETIMILDWFYHLQVPSNQPVSRSSYGFFNVR